MKQRDSLPKRAVRRVMSWAWRGGASTGGTFTGPKFAGAMSYPSLFNFNHDILRTRSRIAVWDAPIARSIVNRLLTHVINNGLTVEATPAWDIIDPKGKIDVKERTAIVRKIQTLFGLWANSTDADSAGRKTFYQLQGFAFVRRFVDGEIMPILRYSGDPRLMSPVQLQFIDPYQVYDPTDTAMINAVEARGNRIAFGFEVDANGLESAMFVYNTPSYGNIVSSRPSVGSQAKWYENTATRVPKAGTKSKRLFYIHSAITENIGQIRGISPLAMIVHELKKITDYGIAELEAAVGNAMFAGYVKPSQTVGASPVVAGIAKRQQQQASPNGSATDTRADVMTKPGVWVQTLKAGEDFVSFDTKRPNVNFGAFVHTTAMHLAGTIGLPVEMLELLFNTSYTASKAAMQAAWNAFEMARYDIAVDFCDPIYEQVIQEWVNSGLLDLPGFNESVVMRRAWLYASWVGIAAPALQPVQEANAAAIRIKEGLTTRSREARIYNGTDFSDNARTLTYENDELMEANRGQTPAPTDSGNQPPQPVQDATQQPSEDAADE